MAVLTQGRELAMSAGGHTYSVPINAADTVYKGASVIVQANGRSVVQASASGFRFAGFATYDQVATAQGDLIQVRWPDRVFLPGSAAVLTDNGAPVYAITDDEIFSVTSTNGTAIGYCYQVVVGEGWWVETKTINT